MQLISEKELGNNFSLPRLKLLKFINSERENLAVEWYEFLRHILLYEVESVYIIFLHVLNFYRPYAKISVSLPIFKHNFLPVYQVYKTLGFKDSEVVSEFLSPAFVKHVV